MGNRSPKTDGAIGVASKPSPYPGAPEYFGGVTGGRDII
jgi:hypothetical protein